MEFIEKYYNDNFNYIEEPFISLSVDYKKSIENSLGFQIFQSQHNLKKAVDNLKDSFDKEIEQLPFLKKMIYTVRFKFLWRKLMRTNLIKR
jgi:hypothetical protein